MSCNIDCGAIPIKVPPADAFIPYVNRAEIAAEEAEENAQQAKEAVESITDISNQVEQVQQLAQQAKESEVNANASAQIATNKANEVSENAQIASTKANEAAASASNIKGIENIVKNYKDEASVSATTAIDKANEAGDSATKAKASETSASTSAQTAITKANEANASANIATDKASEASASAASAKTSENKANEYAKEAKESVDSIDTSNLAKLIDNNTFNGINTFNNTINVPTPIDDSNAINKSYGDSIYSKVNTTMNIKTLTEPLDDWYNLKTGIYAVDVTNFFASSTLHKPPVPQGGICMAYITDTDAQIEFYPDNYNGNPSAPKCVLKKVSNKWANWFTEKAPIFLFVSPAMTGKPTAPTASVDTNTTQLATCEFVKAQSASMQVSTLNTNNNYWTKDPSGIVHQFSKVDATTEEITIPFPISFSSKCLCVMIEILNPDKDISKNVSFNIIEKNVDGIKLLKIGNGNPTITVTAIGA